MAGIFENSQKPTACAPWVFTSANDETHGAQPVGLRNPRSRLVRLQDRQERFLRDLHLADLLHALLALGLLGPELALAGDVAAVALGGDVLLHRRDRFAGDDSAADRGLDGDLEQVPVDLAAQLLDEPAAPAVGEDAVGDDREG